MPIDRWFRTRRVPMTWAAYEALPRHPAYKVEHVEGVTWLTPRHAYVHAVLPLDRARLAGAVDGAAIRRLIPADWEPLRRTFASAFRGLPPFETLDDEAVVEALQESLDGTFRGEDGPLVECACFVAESDRLETRLGGGLLITLLPGGDPEVWDSWHWKEAPPPDSVARRFGRPHLTWVFVHPFEGRRGIASALLAAAVSELKTQGYGELTSAVMSGNLPSVLWHWRQGFQLVNPLARTLDAS